MWQKFVFVVAGYWLLERISRLFPACKLINQEPGQSDSTNHPSPALSLFGGKLRHWVIIFLLGLGVAPAFTHLEQYPIFLDVQDAVGIDWLMRITRQNIPAAQDGATKVPQFVWFDIDDKTHRHWGEPLFTPRNRVQRLIDAAVKAEARLIIVDIDLSRPTPIEGLGEKCKDLKLHPYDENIANYFAQYPTYCKTHPNCPPIILARTFLPSSSDSTKPRPPQQPRLAFSELEQAVTNSDAYLQWATPLFQLSYDQVLRRRSNWQTTCTGELPGIVASTGVTAAVLLDSETPKQAQDIINKALTPLKPQDCAGGNVVHAQSNPPPKEIEIGPVELSTDPFSVRQRIVFNMPWLIKNPETRQLEPLKWLPDEVGFPIVTRLPAYHFAEARMPAAQLESLKNDYVKRGIVIIGGSHSEGRDYHQTPLGLMPGALVLINATHSLLQYKQLEPLSNWGKRLIIATLISVMAVIFLRVSSFWLAQILNLLIVVGMMFVSVILFRSSGVWLDFATPLIFVQLYQIAVFSIILILCLLLVVWGWIRQVFNWLYSLVSRFGRKRFK
jgi:CHASE2 domain-containing sensor protein